MPKRTYDVDDAIESYKKLKQYGAGMYEDAMRQYRAMAIGGDGGLLGYWPDDWPDTMIEHALPVCEPTCRAYNYPGVPDSFFIRVLEGLGEALH